MFLWVGQSVNNQWVESVFGVPSPAHIDPDRPGLPELDNALNRRVHDVIDHVRSTRPRSMRVSTLAVYLFTRGVFSRKFPGSLDFLLFSLQQIFVSKWFLSFFFNIYPRVSSLSGLISCT